jgi:hypothetical protein
LKQICFNDFLILLPLYAFLLPVALIGCCGYLSLLPTAGYHAEDFVSTYLQPQLFSPLQTGYAEDEDFRLRRVSTCVLFFHQTPYASSSTIV